MLTMAADTDTGRVDEAILELLSARLPQARRIANSILRDPVVAEDVVQEAALRAWGSRRSLRDPSSVDAWFSRIVVNASRRQLARTKRQVSMPMIREVVGDQGEAMARREEIGRAINRLDPNEQLLIGLRYGRDLSIPQIADLTGTKEGTVKSRLHAAHQKLRASIDAERRLESEV